MPRAAISAERLIRHFGNVRPAHHDWHTRCANSVGHAVGLRDHPGHGADAYESDLLVAHILRDLRLIHRLGIAVDQ